MSGTVRRDSGNSGGGSNDSGLNGGGIRVSPLKILLIVILGLVLIGATLVGFWLYIGGQLHFGGDKNKNRTTKTLTAAPDSIGKFQPLPPPKEEPPPLPPSPEPTANEPPVIVQAAPAVAQPQDNKASLSDR